MSSEQDAVEPYLTLLEGFVSERLTARAFEQQFLDRYKKDSFRWSAPFFDVLDDLFADVDAYVADGEQRDVDDGDLDDEGLRTSAEAALARLQSL